MRLVAAIVLGLVCVAAAWGKARDLGDLSLEQLQTISVTTASGRPEPLSRALASIFVITGDDIRRSGATSIMEALRLAPNLQVARTGAQGYAITARGFNDPLANKLLVLIDGRSVYTPTFSGVFWDAQDVMLEDVERIEVISGPGGALWGANAVNGIINVLTKSAADTRGGLGIVEGGNEEGRVEVRYGGASRGFGTYRVYAQLSHLDELDLPDGTEGTDGRDRVQAGFRTDFENGSYGFTIQGDLYASESDVEPEPDELIGGNLLVRYAQRINAEDQVRVQAYYDYTSRPQQILDTIDLEAMHTMAARGAHSILLGGGYRRARDRIDNAGPAFAFLPEERRLTSWNLFLQDEIAVRDDVTVSLGLKAERNAYSGIDLLPSVRAGWRFAEESLLWGAATRAVRTPSRFDRDLYLPGTPPFLLEGNETFESEVSWVYELGYRGQATTRFAWSVTGFYHDHHDQRSISPGATAAFVANDLEGHSVGIETWGGVLVTDRWRVSGGYTRLERELSVRPGAVDLQPTTANGSDPKQWFKLRSALDLGKSWELDVVLRWYDRLENIDVPSYAALDARVGFIIGSRVELSLLGQNLLDDGHIEWSPGAELPRAALLKVQVRF